MAYYAANPHPTKSSESYAGQTMYRLPYASLSAALLLVSGLTALPAHADEAPPASSAPVRTAPRPDNTAVNRVDRSDATTTPMDQSNDQASLQVSADIRKAVVADDSLSMMAHNIKIVTEKSTVTLRGPVKTMEEKARIEALASQYAAGATVRNELTVAGK